MGFDVNEGDDREGVKPLTAACSKGRTDIVQCLLDAGAVMDTATSVQNPLFAAIVGRSPEAVRQLLEHGINARARYNSDTMKDMDAVAFALIQGDAEGARIIANWNAGGDEARAREALEEGLLIAKENAFRSA